MLSLIHIYAGDYGLAVCLEAGTMAVFQLQGGYGKGRLVCLLQEHVSCYGDYLSLIHISDKDPSKYPNLVVRVTGFTAYFCSLTPEFRKLVVDRILIQG